MTDLEIQLLAALRNMRRLHNQTVSDAVDVARAHIETDRLLSLQPELDDPNQRYYAPHRVEHRRLVNSIFRHKGW